MGTNNINAATSGTPIPAAHHNSLVSAFKGDVVPRNNSGIAEDMAGSLGTSVLRWLNGFFLQLTIGASADVISLDVEDGALMINVDGEQVKAFCPNDRVTFDGSDPGKGGVVYSAVINHGPISGGTPVTNSGIEITTVGRPLMLMLVPDFNDNSSLIGAVATNTNAAAASFGIRRTTDSSMRSMHQLTIVNNANALNAIIGLSLQMPVGAICTIDNPGPGTHTYDLYCLSASDTASVSSARLMAFEI